MATGLIYLKAARKFVTVLCSAANCLAPSSAGYICIARDHSPWVLVSFRTAAVGARQSILSKGARELQSVGSDGTGAAQGLAV